MDKSKLKASDLQVAAVTATGSATRAFSMTHKMGLAKITLNQKSIPNTITDSNGGSLTSIGNTSVTRTESAAKTTVTASDSFSGNIPFLSGTRTYWAVVKCSTNTTFNSSDAVADAWESAITANIAEGEYASYEANSQRYFANSYTGTFYYCGSNVLSVSLPSTATYTLQAWGAKGGYYRSSSGDDIGGNGGDAKGSIKLTRNTNLFICCGGRKTFAEDRNNAQSYARQYNGGGEDQDPGGGATHIARDTNRGELKNYKNYQSEVLIVGGGGGGADTQDPGGTGGGENGGNSPRNCGKGGTQTSGGDGAYPGSFGEGGGNPNHGSGGGGGGWYGGGSSTNAGDYGGGGGSGHIGTGVTKISMTNGSCTGYGHASITATY